MSATATAAPQRSMNPLSPFTPQQLAQSAAASRIILGLNRTDQSGVRYEPLAYSTSLTPVFGSPTTVQLQPFQAGLVQKYIVEVITTVTNPAGGSTLTRSELGPLASLSNISYTDPVQNQRINTTGWHLASVAAMRRRRVPGAAVTTDSPTGFGSNVQPITAPASIAANASGTVRMIYEIPLATGRYSLKGAIIGNAAFNSQNLSVTFNPNFCQTGTDPLGGASGIGTVYTGAGTGVNAPTFATTINLYQHYYDNFDRALLAPLTPDLSSIYELKSSIFNPIVQGADNYFRYTPLREFWSTVLAYDNNGTMNPGTDVSYFALQAANQTNFWKRSPQLQAFYHRNMFGDDPPPGIYFFDTADEPIVTLADGNTLLIMNPSAVTAGAQVVVGWEDVGISAVLATAPALAGAAG